tara:strand:+ start:1153 stop:1767 length:615 start_codon:yes stop_codon:yes gene_type:complete
MKWIATLLISLLSISVQAQTILVLGDSLSAAYGIELKQGWVHLLEQRLQQKNPHSQVINAGVTGDTTAGGLKRLPTLLQEYQPQLVVIELGGNDGLRGYPLGQLHKNISAMIELSHNSGAEVLLLGIRIPPNYGRRYSEGFFNCYARLASEKQTALVPFFMEGVGDNVELMQADGIHPNASAQPKLLENVWPHLEPIVSSQNNE